MVFGLQPHISLLALRYPVDDLRIRVQESENQGRAETSNAVLRQRARGIVRSCSKLKPAITFLAVHRMVFNVYYRRLEPDEFRVLTALRDGETLADAVAPAIRSQDRLESWFASWARMGWLCKPATEGDLDEERS